MKLYKSEPAKTISDFAKDFNFETLRPYYDSEAPEVMVRMSQYDAYFEIMSYLWPEMTKEAVIQKALHTKSPYDFQTGYMSEGIWKIIKSTSTGLTWSGLENLDRNKANLYIANHRDILFEE